MDGLGEIKILVPEHFRKRALEIILDKGDEAC